MLNRLAYRARLAVAAATAPLLVAVLPGVAAAGPVDPTRPPAEAAPGSSAGSDVPDVALAPPGEALLVDRVDTPVAPGVTHTSFDRIDARGWVRGDVLVADLDAGGLTVDYLNPGSVSGREVLSRQAARKGAIAAVNGDFFDISDTGAPLGVGIQRDGDGGAGELLNGPAAGHNEAAVIGADGLGRLAQVFLAGTASDDTATVGLTNLNSPSVARDGVGLYTPAWGPAPRNRTVDGVPSVREVLLRDGVVVANTATVGTAPLADGELALVGRDAGATALEVFTVGERVDVRYGPRSDAGELAVAIGGNKVLLRDGKVLDVDDAALHPRTAVGFSADGRRTVLLTVDGRQADSRGMTEREIGELMSQMGADDALNLDGGGSSTMLAREPGQAAPDVVNSPSDGGERLTPNGLGLLPASGSGKLTGFHVEPASADDPDENPTADRRVLTGLSRVLVARGHDETLAPVPATPAWNATPSGTARVEPGGEGTAVVTGRARGDVDVVASRGAAAGRVPLDVLGTPVRIEPSTPQVSLAGTEATGSFQVLGYDDAGFGTWIEPRDVRLSYDETLMDVTVDGDGFRVTPRTAGGGVVSVAVGDLTTAVAVTVGLRREVVDPMDDPTGWRATRYPSAVSASLSTAPGRDGGTALALDYSLTGTTATRAAYLTAVPRQLLPGQPQRIGAWVHGDGQGAWLRANIYDAAGGSAKTVNLAASVDWTGWRYVEAEIPSGLTMPLQFYRLYVVETNANRQYSGRIVVDDLTVAGAQPVELPAQPQVADPVVVTDGTVTEEGRWRFAVLSDAQFTADAPASDLVAQARRTIREALAADPEFLVVNGDFVDRGFAQDIELAKRVLDEEVAGRVPVHYVPGNHEAGGPGDLSEWEKVFGPASASFDHNGTRFVRLDSSRGSLRAGGFDQLLELRRQLDDAADDTAVRNVVVLAHHPVDDPAPTDNSQLADRKEAQLLVDWLADLRAETGKGTAYIASHAGTFAASRQDGVLMPLVGNSGKGPAAAPDAGGFTGWMLVGVQEKPRPADAATRHRAAPATGSGSWMRVEMRPHVDELELVTPQSLAAGQVAPVGATVVQDGRRVPVGYPVSADWAGSRSLYIGEPRDAAPHHVAALDPATGDLVGLREGTVEISVTVNGATRSASVQVTAAERQDAA